MPAAEGQGHGAASVPGGVGTRERPAAGSCAGLAGSASGPCRSIRAAPRPTAPPCASPPRHDAGPPEGAGCSRGRLTPGAERLPSTGTSGAAHDPPRRPPMRLPAAFCIAATLVALGGRADPAEGRPGPGEAPGRVEDRRVRRRGREDHPRDGGQGGRRRGCAHAGDRGPEGRVPRQQLDSTKSPKWLDLIADKSTVVPCIYDLDGDALRIRFPRGGKDRPAEFEPKKDATNVRLLSLKRDKAAPPPPA